MGGDSGMPRALLWASLRGHPWSCPTTRKHPVPVFWRGSRSLILMTGSVTPIPWAANRLCPPDSRCFKVLPGTSTHLCSGTNCVLKVRFWCLTNSGTTAPGAKLCFPQGVHFPPGSWLGPWQHLPSPVCPAAALGQARSFRHGVGRGRAAPPCPPRAEGSVERKLLLTELRALPDWG